MKQLMRQLMRQFHSIGGASSHRHDGIVGRWLAGEVRGTMAFMKHALLSSLLAVFLMAGPLVSQPLAGQQAPPVPDVTPELLDTYTRAHIALEAVRDAFHLELGRTHDLQGQARLRAELSERTEAVLSEHELMPAVYERITALISVDPALRVRFEAMRAELTAGQGSSPG